jgi:hypothetical protein
MSDAWISQVEQQVVAWNDTAGRPLGFGRLDQHFAT